MQPFRDPIILPCGDSAVTVQFGEEINEATNARAIAFDRAVQSAAISAVIETVPCYASVLVHYDCRQMSFADLSQFLLPLAQRTGIQSTNARHWTVPVIYGGAHGPALEDVATATGLSPEAVIAAHAGAVYRVAMLGFTPGFAYLMGLDSRLRVPRRASPIPRAEAGTISLAAGQAAIQSQPGPTGWHVIGRTPVRNFDIARNPAFLFEPGDTITFTRIDAETFAALDAAAARGETIVGRVT